MFGRIAVVLVASFCICAGCGFAIGRLNLSERAKEVLLLCAALAVVLLVLLVAVLPETPS